MKQKLCSGNYIENIFRRDMMLIYYILYVKV